jgi:hypothetical protein
MKMPNSIIMYNMYSSLTVRTRGLSLMNSVENNYQTQVEAGTWPKTFADKEGKALQAEIQAMKATQGRNSKKNDAKAKAQEEKYAWKKVGPKDGESKSKTF